MQNIGAWLVGEVIEVANVTVAAIEQCRAL